MAKGISDIMWPVIIGGIIAILVAAVVLYMFLGGASNTSKTLNSCSGVCLDKSADCPADKPISTLSAKCIDNSGKTVNDGKCCFSIA